MATFTDSEKNTWTLRITPRYLPALREAGLDLGKVRSSKDAIKDVIEFLGDPENLAKVLWVLCETQRGDRTEEAFKDLFDGETVQAAFPAAIEAAVDFTQSPGAAKKVRKLLGDATEKLERKAMQKLEGIESSMETNIGLIDSAGNWPGSPEWTAPTSPSAS